MNALQPRVILTLSAGGACLGKRELVWGAAVAPFSVGAEGDWPIGAPGLAETQLFLAFDGYRLHAAAASASQSVYVDGVPLGPEWTHVAVPSLLVFGAASIAVECEDASRSASTAIRARPIVDLARADRQPTQVVDLSSTLQMRTVRLEVSPRMLAELREAAAEEPLAATPLPAAPAPSLPSGDTLIFQPAPVQTLMFPLPSLQQRAPTPDLSNTLYDGGALRERAAQLANLRPSEEAAAGAQSVPVPAAKPSLLRRPWSAFRTSSLPKQLTIALLPLALAGVWAMRDGSASASSGPTVAASAKPRPAAVNTPLARTTSSNPAPPPAWLPERAPAAEPPTVQVPGQTSDPNERLALIAASSGNRVEAAALYERLANAHHSRTFALAARLSREDRVRKP